MKTTSITIEHIVVESDRSFEQVTQALEERLGLTGNWEAIARRHIASNASWEQVTRSVEALIGTSGFTIFGKVDHGALLSLARKPGRAYQYGIGNPLLAVQMDAYTPEVALYAPLRLVVYEDHESKTFVAYDRFTSQIAQYQREEIARVAQIVQQKLETLVAEVTGSGQKTLSGPEIETE